MPRPPRAKRPRRTFPSQLSPPPPRRRSREPTARSSARRPSRTSRSAVRLPSDTIDWVWGYIAEVSAVVDRFSSLEITTDDIADMTVRFASVTVGNIHMNLIAWNVHSHFELMGEEGVIQWRRFENEIRLFDPKANRWEIYPFACQLNDMYVEEARHFLACIRDQATPACDGWDGLKTMRVIDAAVKASAERRWVRV